MGRSRDLLALLADARDPRGGGGRVHPARFVLAVMIIALTSPGYASFAGAAQLAGSWPRRVLLRVGARPDPLTAVVRPPSEATIRRLVSALDPDELQAVIDTWTASCRRPPRSRGRGRGRGFTAVAIDGKSVRGAVDADGAMPHLIAAAAHHEPVVLTQVKVPAKTSEIPAVAAMFTPGALASWGLGPVVITVDALHTHASTASAILAAGGHYVMTVKGNTPNLRAAVVAAIPDVSNDDAARFDRERTRGHGRTDERHLLAAPATGVTFPGAAQVARVVRYRGDLTGQRESKEVVHVLTSLPTDLAGPRELAALVRGHWAIENAVHHVRDTTFAEDACRARTGNAPQNLAALRNAIITAIRTTGAHNIAAARRWAGTTAYRAIKLLTGRAKRDIGSL